MRRCQDPEFSRVLDFNLVTDTSLELVTYQDDGLCLDIIDLSSQSCQQIYSQKPHACFTSSYPFIAYQDTSKSLIIMNL